MRRLLALAMVCAPLAAHAWPYTPPAAPDEPPAAAPPAPADDPPSAPPRAAAPPAAADDAPPSVDEIQDDVDDLDRRIQKLERAQRSTEKLKDKVSALDWLQRYINVFVDVGAFAVGGNGSGIRSDLLHLQYPQYDGHVAGQWVFMGDPLSTMVNSLGEPADIGSSRELHDDPLASRGHPTLLVNSVGLSIGKYLGHGISLSSLVELLPRPRENLLDIETAQIRYRPTDKLDLELAAGKIDSVLGVEYRAQDAPLRLGVTPSLICRYTCGRPLGATARLVRGRLAASGAMIMGDFFSDRFEPRTSIHVNALPTVAAHLQWMLPIGQGLEVGMSGAYGPQENQPDLSVRQWHVGADAKLTDLDGFDAVAEYVQGKQPGATMTVACDLAPCLTYKGAYLLVDRRVNTWLTPYVRIDWRDAVHQSGVQFVYESHVARATLGAQFAMTMRILAKIEYTFNRELDNIPDFPNDILTTSIVVATD